jgi:hypothetical protein
VHTLSYRHGKYLHGDASYGKIRRACNLAVRVIFIYYPPLLMLQGVTAVRF